MLKGPLQAHCAICRGDSAVCGHEAERLRQALQDAQARWLAQDRIRDVRHWVLTHAREMILNTYQTLADTRQHQYEQHLSTLQCYNLFVIYRGDPPIPADQLHRLNIEMKQARDYLQQNLNQDWAACLQKYPDTLDYFFSLVYAEVPADDDPRVEHPVIAGASVPGEKKRRNRTRNMDVHAGVPPMPPSMPFGYGRHAVGPGMSGSPPMHGPGPFAGPGFGPY